MRRSGSTSGRIETLKDGAEAYGNRVRVKVVKNKVAPPFKQAEFDIIYGSGISWEGTVLDVGIERKVVQKAGSYFSFGDERLGQGRQNATAFLGEHPDLVQQILARIQAEAPPEQVVSARLLPQAEGAVDVDVTPIEDDERRDREGPGRGLEPTGNPTSRERDGRRHRSPVVTALRARGNDRVEIDLDGHPWRIVPTEAVYGPPVGRQRRRSGDRALAREGTASARKLVRRLCRLSAHAITPSRHSSSGSQTEARHRESRRQTLEAARRAGLVDDRRFARDRATLLAGRGAGITSSRADLERCGVSEVEICEVLGAARARVEPGSPDHRGERANSANSPSPGGQGLLGGDTRDARCGIVLRTR